MTKITVEHKGMIYAGEADLRCSIELVQVSALDPSEPVGFRIMAEGTKIRLKAADKHKESPLEPHWPLRPAGAMKPGETGYISPWQVKILNDKTPVFPTMQSCANVRITCQRPGFYKIEGVIRSE